MSRKLRTAGLIAVGALALSACGTVVASGHHPHKHGLLLGATSVDPVVGQAVVYTATIAVTAPGSGTPTGTVDFEDNGTAISGCSAVTVASSAATCGAAYGSVGTHSITATYSGDSNFAGSMSSALSVTVSQASTSVTLTEGSAAVPAAAFTPSRAASVPFDGPARLLLARRAKTVR